MASGGGGGGGEGAVIRVKATVNREKNTVVFVEADAELADVLFSYLTLPMATIINLSRKHPPVLRFGCFDNLYRSVENLESHHFRTPKCKEMLLRPLNGAAAYCQYLKLNVEDDPGAKREPITFFCFEPCTRHEFFRCRTLYSYDAVDACRCGKSMTNDQVPLLCDYLDFGLFARRFGRLIISDDLRVMPASTTAMLSSLSNHGVSDAGAVEVRSLEFGVSEALDLLKMGFVSKTPLSDVLTLKRSKVAKTVELSTKGSFGVLHHRHRHHLHQPADNLKQAETTATTGDRIKLVYSKTKKKVLYVEAGGDFVDMLFSFLVIPLGHMYLKQVEEHDGSSRAKGCMKNLYKSVQDLRSQDCFVTPSRTRVLLRPKLAAAFGYQEHPLGLEEVKYYNTTAVDGSSFISPLEALASCLPTCAIREPKSPWVAEAGVEGVVRSGYVWPWVMYTITDDLNIWPISAASTLAILRSLNVSFSEVEVKTIRVGKQEASSLLMASLTSASPLTAVFFDQVD